MNRIKRPEVVSASVPQQTIVAIHEQYHCRCCQQTFLCSLVYIMQSYVPLDICCRDLCVAFCFCSWINKVNADFVNKFNLLRTSYQAWRIFLSSTLSIFQVLPDWLNVYQSWSDGWTYSVTVLNLPDEKRCPGSYSAQIIHASGYQTNGQADGKKP